MLLPISKRCTIFCIMLLISSALSSQVGIGTTEPKAMLDIYSDNSGILIPRVALVATDEQAPITAPTPEIGLLVFNTATAGTAPNNVTPGFYYWNGSQWVELSSSTTTGEKWDLSGNAGTTPGTNFIGTTDNVSLELFSNNNSRMRIQNNGQTTIGFGAGNANAGQQFNVVSNFVDGVGVGGYSGGAGRGIYGQNVGNGYGVYGLHGNSTNVGYGVFGESFYGNGVSVYGLDGPIVADNVFFGGDGIQSFTNANSVFNSIWGVNLGTGTSISGATNNLSVTPIIGAGVAGSGNRIGVFGYAGVGNVENGNRGNTGGQFYLDADSDPTTNNGNNGYRASARLAGFDNIAATGTGVSPPTLPLQNSYFGGYFAGGSHSNGTPSYAYVGLRHNTNNNGTTGTDYKIIGPGTVSTLINDSQGTTRIMFAPESPEIVFQDYGVGQLVNGQARINLDPILKSALHIDENHPLKVFVTLEGDCNGVYVTDKTADGFTVKELKGGTSNVPFSWQIVANRADTKDVNGNIVSKHVGLRLPIGPSMLEPMESSLNDTSKERKIIDREALLSDSLNDDENILSEEQLKERSQKLKTTTKQK